MQGCNRGCKGCHNPELASFEGGDELTPAKILEVIIYLREREAFFEVISFTGGDPLCNTISEVSRLAEKLREEFPTKEFWLFTGAERSELLFSLRYWFDVIKTGPYKEELKQEGFPASSNQQLLYKGKDYL